MHSGVVKLGHTSWTNWGITLCSIDSFISYQTGLVNHFCGLLFYWDHISQRSAVTIRYFQVKNSFQYLYKVNNIIKILEVADIMKKIVIYVMQFVHCASTQVVSSRFSKMYHKKNFVQFHQWSDACYNFPDNCWVSIYHRARFFIILQSNAWSWNSTASLHCMQYFIYLHKYNYISNGIFLHTFLTIEKKLRLDTELLLS